MSKENNIRRKLQVVASAFPNNDVYIFGETVRDMIVGKEVDTLNVFVKCNKSEKSELYSNASQYFSSQHDVDFSSYLFLFDKKLDLSSKVFSIDTIYCNVKDLLKGDFDFFSDHKGVQDINKKIVRILSKNIDKVDNQPILIFKAIKLATQIGFNIEVETMSKLFSKRGLLQSIPTRSVYREITDIFKSAIKPRKAVAFLNTIGISKELFGFDLEESASLNHLYKNDVYEFISLCFSHVDKEKIDSVLYHKFGMQKSEIETVKNIILAVGSVEEENEISARKVLNICGKERATNITRLLKAIGMKDLAKKVKEQKNSVVTFSELAITVDDIKASFNIEDDEVERMLSIAMNSVLEDPNINERSTLLIMLNKLRKA